MTRHLRARLMDIRDNIAIVVDLAKDRTRNHLEHDIAFRYAVHHAVLIITEAVRHLPNDIKQQYPEQPWKDIETTGNYLRHEYFRIDTDVMWSVVQIHLPQLGTIIDELTEKALQDA